MRSRPEEKRKEKGKHGGKGRVLVEWWLATGGDVNKAKKVSVGHDQDRIASWAAERQRGGSMCPDVKTSPSNG